jgi:uncharacterized protein YyaL (SSP411 family)
MVAVAGPRGDARASALWKTALAAYRPGKVVVRIGSDRGAGAMPAAARAMLASSAGSRLPLAFVCAGTACAMPVGTPAKLAEVVRDFGVAGRDKTTLANDGPAHARPPM